MSFMTALLAHTAPYGWERLRRSLPVRKYSPLRRPDQGPLDVAQGNSAPRWRESHSTVSFPRGRKPRTLLTDLSNLVAYVCRPSRPEDRRHVSRAGFLWRPLDRRPGFQPPEFCAAVDRPNGRRKPAPAGFPNSRNLPGGLQATPSLASIAGQMCTAESAIRLFTGPRSVLRSCH
jgi:hypothetical protein